MAEPSCLARAFPGAGKRLEDLRRRDARFDEVCRDYLELCGLMERLGRAAPRDAEGLEIIATSLADLKLEIAERLDAAAHATATQSQGDGT